MDHADYLAHDATARPRSHHRAGNRSDDAYDFAAHVNTATTHCYYD